MTTRTNLTEGKLRTLRTPPLGKRGEVLDSIVPGLSVRCTDKGRKSYMLRARFPFTFDRVAGKLVPWPGPRPQSTRVLLGEVGAMDLETARETARRWLELIEQGVDPRTLNRERPEVSRAVTRWHPWRSWALDSALRLTVNVGVHSPPPSLVDGEASRACSRECLMSKFMPAEPKPAIPSTSAIGT